MEPRVVVYGVALALFALGIWASSLGWRQDWTVNGVMLRGGGLLAIIAAIYVVARSKKV